MSKQDNTSSNNRHFGNDEAADLVRQQINALHDTNATSNPVSKPKQSLIDEFWKQHKDHPDQQTAWNTFYNSLDDNQKQILWEEYHDIKMSDDGQVDDTAPKIASPPEEAFSLPEAKPEAVKVKKSTKTENVAQTKKRLLKNVKKTPPKRQRGLKYHMRPILIAVLVMLLIFSMNYNELVVAQVKQYISPGSSLQTPIIIDPNANIQVGKESKIIIPKINVDVPVVYDVKTFDEQAIQNALERGVVHYGNTAVPGQPGNNVIVGHSSNNFFNSGKYKFAFVLLDRLEINDTFILHYNSTRYVYKVTKKKVIEPNDFSLIQPTAVPTTTLITCTPPGTSWKRLVVQGEQISPEPSTKKADTTKAVTPSDQSVVVPGNAPSFFQRIRDWLFND